MEEFVEGKKLREATDSLEKKALTSTNEIEHNNWERRFLEQLRHITGQLRKITPLKMKEIVKDQSMRRNKGKFLERKLAWNLCLNKKSYNPLLCEK